MIVAGLLARDLLQISRFNTFGCCADIVFFVAVGEFIVFADAVNSTVVALIVAVTRAVLKQSHACRRYLTGNGVINGLILQHDGIASGLYFFHAVVRGIAEVQLTYVVV